MKPKKPILPYKVGRCIECSYSGKKLISKRCFEQPNFCYQKFQKEKYLEKQKGKELKPLKPIKKVADKRAKENIIYEKNKKEHFLEHPICEFPNCQSEDVTLHHSTGKIGKLLYDKTHFKSLCWPHHFWCELHPKEAKELGLSFDRLSI
jgi:hypothetical protein